MVGCFGITGAAGAGGSWAGGRTAAGLGRNSNSKGLDAAPGCVGIGTGITRWVGEERDDTSRIKLDERRDTGDVRGFRVLDCRGSESPCAVVLDIDDVGSGEIIGNESEFLLNAGCLEERSGLSMGSGERLIARVALNLGLKVGN